MQETELLKREGGDTALAAQWRQRYEKLSLEKVLFTFFSMFLTRKVFFILTTYFCFSGVCHTTRGVAARVNSLDRNRVADEKQ